MAALLAQIEKARALWGLKALKQYQAYKPILSLLLLQIALI